MNINDASQHQKFRWIEEGKHLEELKTDTNGWVKIRAVQKTAELNQQKHVDDRVALKGSMDADLFEVIQLSAKTEEQIYALIAENKFLTHFSRDHRLGVRIRAKAQMKLYLKEQEIDIYSYIRL